MSKFRLTFTPNESKQSSIFSVGEMRILTMKFNRNFHKRFGDSKKEPKIFSTKMFFVR